MLKDIYNLLKSITFIDYVFFFTVIFLIILVICLVYFIKINGKVVETEDILDDPDNLKAIADKIENTPAKPVTFTSYEQEQEEKAIISYDELLSNTGEYQLNYSDEETKDDLTVKKFDLEHLTSPSTVETPKEDNIEVPKEGIHLLSLDKEEAFLKALKELQQSLY